LIYWGIPYSWLYTLSKAISGKEGLHKHCLCTKLNYLEKKKLPMEQTNLLNDFDQPVYEPATVGQRFANYLIDIIVYYIFVIIISFVFGLTGALTAESGAGLGLYYLISFSLFFIYYILLEGSKGKTVGKMVTKTKVITEDGAPITFGQAFMRTLCRIVPFEFISAFMGTQMWHDKWVKTMVVKDR
jgi:uncharacterized RDD family membrane protein YckC